MAEPKEDRTIGSAWCPCGKHKAEEQVICFTCFFSLPMVVKYGLCSLRLEIRLKSMKLALDKAAENREPKPRSSEGELFR